MKHLRKFNEGLSSNEYEELKEFCESCLAYLLDEGFELELVDKYGRDSNDPSYEIDSDYFWIDLYGPVEDNYGVSYNWDQIKDYYIPFLKLVKARYILVDDERSHKGDKVYFKIQEGQDADTVFKNFTLEEVIDDKITLDSILSVSVKVSSKI